MKATEFLTILLLMLAKGLFAKRKIVNIFWNTTNPMFRIDNTDNVIDINEANLPWEYDQVNLFCPTYPEGTREADMERYIIYSVSRNEYDNCRIFSPEPKVVAVCDSPHKVSFVTITFRSFTPTPGGLEFKPGHDYFFISTSSRSDLYRRANGRCSTNNMKAMFKVAKAAHERSPNRRIDDDVDEGDDDDAGNRSRLTVNVPRRTIENVYKDYNALDDSFQSEDDVDVTRKRHSDDYVQQQASVMHHSSSSTGRIKSLDSTLAVFIVITALFVSLKRTRIT